MMEEEKEDGRTTVDALVARRLNLDQPLLRKALERATMKALRRTVQHALQKSSLYRQRLRGIDPGSLMTMDDLAAIPLLSAADIASQGHRLLCVSQGQVARVITLQTSGSTGTPKRLFFSAADLASTMDFFHHGMRSLIEGDDRVLVLLPFEQPDCVGDLLLRALRDGGIFAEGRWPPPAGSETEDLIAGLRISSIVGLPQHLLAISHTAGADRLRSMLLCSDYAPESLRRQIEANCGCETFLHYGTTESGLGGAVECSRHDGCHIRESDLLLEIIDPQSGRPLPEGELGEVVITTLGREAMPLIRYRTGDLAVMDSSPCPCGGVTARLRNIRGRLQGCLLESGNQLCSQDLDDNLFQVRGLLDYRTILGGRGPARLQVEFQAAQGDCQVAEEISRMLLQVPAIRDSLATGNLVIGSIRGVDSFAASHTLKRAILDQRQVGEDNASCA